MGSIQRTRCEGTPLPTRLRPIVYDTKFMALGKVKFCFFEQFWKFLTIIENYLAKPGFIFNWKYRLGEFLLYERLRPLFLNKKLWCSEMSTVELNPYNFALKVRRKRLFKKSKFAWRKTIFPSINILSFSSKFVKKSYLYLFSNFCKIGF